MNNSYCGKDCSSCMRREELNCPGCRPESGISFCRDCEIAKCCRSKGHETCDTCSMKDAYCSIIRKKDEYPERQERENRFEEEKRIKDEQEAVRRIEIAMKMGKLMGFLFIISVVVQVFSLVVELVGLPADIPEAVFSLAYAAVLYSMNRYDERYKAAALCGIPSAIVNAFGEPVGIMSFLSLIFSGIGLYGEYQELMAHANIMSRYDSMISTAWEKWARRYLYCFGGLFLAFVIMVIAPVLGAILIMAIACVILAFAFAKIWYLHRSEKVLKEYTSYRR